MPGKPVILWGTAAALWAAAIAVDTCDLGDIRAGDLGQHLWAYTLCAACTATIAAVIWTIAAQSIAVNRALTRTILTRPHDRDHEETGPLAKLNGADVFSLPSPRKGRARPPVSGLRKPPGQHANR